MKHSILEGFVLASGLIVPPEYYVPVEALSMFTRTNEVEVNRIAI